MIGAKRKSTTQIRIRPTVEVLEDRCLLSGNVLQTNLVSDLPGVAQFTDPNLVNPWGISESPTSPFWVSDAESGKATVYDTSLLPGSPVLPLVVSIPAPAGSPAGATGAPTGTVFNIALGSGAFKIPQPTGPDAPAVFLFATEDGTIAGWNPGVGTQAVIAVDNSKVPGATDGAVYKGLAIATDPTFGPLLYASNFHSGHVDVFDASFKPVATLPVGAFTDSKLPNGYAPFNVQAIGSHIYVTYAKQDADKHDDVPGPGHGFIDVYNLDGSGGHRLISRRPLDAPWGLAIAPSSFGSLAGALLVGNFGDGRINAFNPTSGKYLGTLKDPDGETLEIDGLWALQVGNGAQGGDANKVYFTAGIANEEHGLFGSLTPVAQGTPEGPAEAQALRVALLVYQEKVATVLQDISTGVSGAELRQAIQEMNTAFRDLVRSGRRLEADVRSDRIHHHPHDAADEDFLKDVLDVIFAHFGRHR